jgi:hypothetical protein
MLSANEIAHYKTFGFLLLRQAFDPAPLSGEFNLSMQLGFALLNTDSSFITGQTGRYLPMMCEQTPVSLSLLFNFHALAVQLLGGEVLPTRAKGVLYSSSTGWHTDSTYQLQSLGFACYLEPLTRTTGALQVIPGSHLTPAGEALDSYLHMDPPPKDLPSFAIETNPGDVIVFDEHLYHASTGGTNRRQWRIDFLAAPKNPEQEIEAKAYYTGIYPPDWDGGYDADLFPTYGVYWRQLVHPWHQGLARVGAYRAASIEEDFMRAKRLTQRPYE